MIDLLNALDPATLDALALHSRGLVAVEEALMTPREARVADAYGEYAWAAVLDDDELTDLVGDLAAAIGEAVRAGDTTPVVRALRPYRAIARVVGSPEPPVTIGVGTPSWRRFVDTDPTVAAW